MHGGFSRSPLQYSHKSAKEEFHTFLAFLTTSFLPFTWKSPDSVGVFHASILAHLAAASIPRLKSRAFGGGFLVMYNFFLLSRAQRKFFIVNPQEFLHHRRSTTKREPLREKSYPSGPLRIAFLVFFQ